MSKPSKEAAKMLNDERVATLLEIVMNCQSAVDTDEEHARFSVVVGAPWAPQIGQEVPITQAPNMKGAPVGFIVGVEEDVIAGYYQLIVEVDAVDMRAWSEDKLRELGLNIRSLVVEPTEP